MRLLVSVWSANEAAVALAGGADVIDVKEPLNGPLGAVSLETLRQVCRVVGHGRPVTAALGDAGAEDAIEARARQYAASGAELVKVGLAGVDSRSDALALIRAAVRGTSSADSRCGLVVVAYADAA